MATTNRDFVIRQGLKVLGTGVTFPDNTTQTTAFTGGLQVDIESTNPGSGTNGDTYFNSTDKRLVTYYNGTWYEMANYVDSLFGGILDGGEPSSTFTQSIDGGTPSG